MNDQNMVDSLYTMMKQFLENYDKNKVTLINPKDDSFKDNVKTTSEIFTKNNTINVNCEKRTEQLNNDKVLPFETKNQTKDLVHKSFIKEENLPLKDNEKNKDLGMQYISEEEDLIREIEYTYKEKFPLNFLNELQQHSSQIFETETTFTEQKNYNKKEFLFKTIIPKTNFCGTALNSNKKEAKRLAAVNLIKSLLKDPVYKQVIKNYVNVTGNKFLGKKRELKNNNLMINPDLDMKYSLKETSKIIESNRDLIKQEPDQLIAIKKIDEPAFFPIIQPPVFTNEFDIYCLVKERSLILNYKEIIDLYEITNMIEGSTKCIEDCSLIKCGSFNNNTMRRSFVSIDLVVILKNKQDKVKEYVDKIMKILSNSLKNYKRLVLKKQRDSSNSYQYSCEDFIVISGKLNNSNTSININYYIRNLEEIYVKNFISYMNYFSHKELTLNQIISITIAKEWRRKMDLIPLKSELIELLISNSSHNIVGKILINFIFDLAGGLLEREYTHVENNLISFYISTIDEINKLKIRKSAINSLKTIDQNFTELI